MTVDYAINASTGSWLYDKPALASEEIEADLRRTHVVFNCVRDPVLRDALETFQAALVRKPSSLTTRIAHLSSHATTLEALLPVVLSTGQAPIASASVDLYAATGVAYLGTATEKIGGILGDLIAVTAGPAWPLDTQGIVARTAEFILASARFPISTALPYASEGIRDEIPIAASAVEQIADWLGLPTNQVLKATGIRKRTYQAWKRNKTRRPRQSSQGRLWDLHRLAEDLVEAMGITGLRTWLSQEPERVRLLRSGALDELAAQAYASSVMSTRVRPPWANSGSVESHSVPRRSITVPPMDPGDVVEH